jgi:hypothetical protein
MRGCGVYSQDSRGTSNDTELERLKKRLQFVMYCIDCFVAEPDVAEMIHMHDEQALRIKKHMVQIKKFTSEEEGRQFVENWKGEQISPLMHDKNWYIVLPNDISRAISDAILKTEKLLKLSVHLQTEIMVNYNWAKCH